MRRGGWIWYRYSRVLYRYSKCMVQVKLGYGTGTVRLWYEYSSDMVRVRFGYGTGTVRLWYVYGSVMVPPFNLSAHPYFSSL